MKAGKPSESVLSRSVLKQLNKENGSGVSRMKQLDYGSFAVESIASSADDKIRIVLSSQISVEPSIAPTRYAIHSAVSNVMCAGANPTGIMLTILFPTEGAEQELRAIVKEADETCAGMQIPILGGHTEIMREIKRPIVQVTATGAVAEKSMLLSSAAKPEMELVVVKEIALAGTAILAAKEEETLLTRYTAPFIDQAKRFDEAISVGRAAEIARDYAVSMHDVSLGGIYGALWEMADRSNVGLEVDLKAIPIRQETIEICEKLDINPYKLYGLGCLLVATKRGEELVEALAREGIVAAIIGHTTAGNDRILFTGEESRFLEMTQSDELYKFR